MSQKKAHTILDNKPAVWNWLRHAELDIILPLITLVTEHGCKMLYPFMRRLRKNRYDSIWGKTELNNRDVEKLHRLEIPCSNYQSNH